MEYTFHNVADIFPMMDDSEFKALCADIAENGLREQIWLHEGKIIDGRNRYNACLKTGVVPRFKDWDGKGGLISFVISLNLNRRHLTASQKAAVAHDLLPMLEREAKERQRAAGIERAVSAERDESGQLVEQIPQASQQQHVHTRSVEQAAKIVGVNSRYVQDMKTIAREAPEKVELIKKGEKNIKQVMKEVKPPKLVKKPAASPKNEEYVEVDKQPEDFAKLAIGQLEQINNDDPGRIPALQLVMEWVNAQLE